MKTKKLLLTSLLVLSGFGMLASCGGEPAAAVQTGISITINGPTQVEVGNTVQLAISLQNDVDRLGYSITSSDETVATVDPTGLVTGVKVGSTTITVTSRKDETIKQTYPMMVIGSTIPTLTIEGLNDTIYLGDVSTLSLTAKVENAGNYDIRYEWSNLYGSAKLQRNALGTLVGNNQKEQQYIAHQAGTDVISVKAYVGPYCLTASYNIYIKNEVSLWKVISTKEEFLEFIHSGKNNFSYYLANDIDLEGAKINGSNTGLEFSGVLDGRGHTVKNYVIEGTSDTDASNGGLISTLDYKGKILNLGVEAEINEKGSGWGSAALVNVCNGYIQNCSVKVDHSFDTSTKLDANYWFPFVAGVYGTGDPVVRDCVVEVKDTAGYKTIYADTCYPADGVSPAHTKEGSTYNFYTNTTVVGGQLADNWGAPITDLSGYHTGINFASTEASFYALNTNVWNLVDNQMPTLVTQD